MNRVPVESSLIRSVAYDAPSSILQVELAEDGAVYEYFDVPMSAYLELLEAKSKGSYYNEYIKDLYAYRRSEAPARPPATFGMLVTRPISADTLARIAEGPIRGPAWGAWPRRQVALEREIAVYRASLPDFLEDHEGQFVLIHGDDVIGFWPTRKEALEVGYDRFGLVPLLAKQVLRAEPVYSFSRSI